MTKSIAYIAACLILISCKKEIINGCTDPTSQNFDAEVTDDDGSCIYPRDVYLGNWKGLFDASEDQFDDPDFEIFIVKSSSVSDGIVIDFLCCPQLNYNGMVKSDDSRLIVDHAKEVRGFPNRCVFPITSFNGTVHFKATMSLQNNNLIGSGSIVEADEKGVTQCAFSVSFNLEKQ